MELELVLERARLEYEPNRLLIPAHTLVILCAPSGSGKSSFSTKNFPPTWVISTDKLRGIICDNQRNMESNAATFDLLFRLVDYRLQFKRTTIVDSTALAVATRLQLLDIARRHNFGTLLVLFDVPQEICRQRDANRIDPPPVGASVIAYQFEQYRETSRLAPHEGFDRIITLTSAQAGAVEVEVVKN